MKKLNEQKLETLIGGVDDGTACGLAIAVAICIPNPFTLIAAAGFCLVGDTPPSQ
jgi:hypothetical protein